MFLPRRLYSSSYVTQGDVVAQILIAIYVFELFYRVKISPVSVGYRVGTTMIGKAAIGIPLNQLIEEMPQLSLGQISDLFSIYKQFP